MQLVVVEAHGSVIDLIFERKRAVKQRRWWRQLRLRCGGNGDKCGVTLWRLVVVEWHGGVVDLRSEKEIEI